MDNPMTNMNMGAKRSANDIPGNSMNMPSVSMPSLKCVIMGAKASNAPLNSPRK